MFLIEQKIRIKSNQNEINNKKPKHLNQNEF